MNFALLWFFYDEWSKTLNLQNLIGTRGNAKRITQFKVSFNQTSTGRFSLSYAIVKLNYHKIWLWDEYSTEKNILPLK